jgi:hypothetical protein
VDAVRRTSVLESQRLQAALSRLSSSDLSTVSPVWKRWLVPADVGDPRARGRP